MSTTVNPRSIGVEGRYLHSDVLELAALRRRLLDRGTTPPVANGVIGWLTGKIAGEPDIASARSRAEYRRLLRELDGDGGPPGQHKGRRHNRPDRGRGTADNPRRVRYDAVSAVAA